jgi:hypothetical protein
MNERIRRIMEQAVISIDGQTFGKTYIPDTFTEKFAELILQDCMSICEEQGDKGLDGHYCVDKIRKEFGV